MSFVLAAVIGYVLLRRRIGALGLRRVFATLTRLAVVAGLIAGGTGADRSCSAWTLGWARTRWPASSSWSSAALVLVVGYLAAAFALRVREIRDLGRWSGPGSRAGIRYRGVTDLSISHRRGQPRQRKLAWKYPVKTVSSAIIAE